MTLAERIAAELHRVSTDRYMFGLFGDGRMGSGGFGKLQILGKTKHVTRCQNCGRAGLKHAVVCAVVGEDGHPTNQYYYFGTDCAARLAGKPEKDVEAEAEHQESSGRPRMKNLKPAKPNDGQMELGLRFAAYLHDLMTERYARAKASKGQMGFDFDSLASAPQAPAPAAAPAKPAVSEPPALPVKGKQMGLFDQPEQPKTVASGNATNWDAMSLADKLAWQKSNGKTRPDGTAAPAITKPQATPKVNLSGAVYEFVGHNENGTIRVRNDQGDEFDSQPGEQWKQHGEHPVPSSPAKAGGWNEEKHPRWEAGDKQHHGGQFAPKEHKPHKHGELESAENVLERVKSSPNQPKQRDWGRYASQFGIEGDFKHVDVPADQLKAMIASGHLRTSQSIDPDEVGKKARSGQRNPVVITNEPGKSGLVVDGNHSLQAALKAGDGKVKAIVPVSHALAAVSPKESKQQSHKAIYNGKEIDADDFKQAANRVHVNLKSGEHGYVRTPEGKLFEIAADKKMAVPVDAMRSKEQRDISLMEERVGKAQSPQEKAVLSKRLDEMKAAVAPKESKSELAIDNPPFRDFRYVPKHRNAGSLYPNRPGQLFTDEQQQQLKNWARQNGMMVSSDSGPGAIHVVHNDHRSRLDLTLHGAEGVKREAAAVKSKQAAEQESARKQQANADLAGREAAGFINEAFGDSLNTYNKTKLADFLEGKDKKFGGLWSRAHAESLQKLGAIDSTGQVNFDAIRKAFEQHGKAATASGPQEPAKPDLQAIAAEARAAGGNLWVTAKKHGIGITHPQASELAKVFQGMGEAEKPQPGPGQLRGQAKFAETRAQEEPKAEPSHLQALRGLVGDEHYGKIAGEFDRAFREFDSLPQEKKNLEFRANETRSKSLQTELGAKITYAGLRVGLLGDGMEKLARGIKQIEDGQKPGQEPKAAEGHEPYEHERYPGKWLVPSKAGVRGFGDTLHSSKDEAIAESHRVASRLKSQQEATAKAESQEKAGADRKAAFKASGLTPAQAALQARVQAHLGQQVSAQGNVTTRQALLDKELAEGHKPTMREVPDEAARAKAAKEAEFMLKRGVPTGNESHPDTIKLRELQAKAKSAMKQEHVMEKGDGVYRPLSKMEHDYAAAKYQPKAEPAASPQPAQSVTAASGGAVAPESQPAESVGSRVAAAITKRSMDFGRKVEVRKDRAKSTGPKAKKQVGEWDLDEGWAKRYQITQVASSKDPSEVGKFIITDKKQKGPWYAKDQGVQVGGQYSSAEEAKQALPLIEVARNHRVYEGRDGKWHIYRKLGDRHHVSVKSFPSQEEAMKYMAMNPREIIGHKFPRYETYQYLTEVERKGPERRKGTVNEQDFQKAFAPGGAVFGNWMTNKDGVTAFHHAYDSLHDLADVLDLHPHQVSIDGDLVFGFGAAGSGGKDAARAHYEPGQRLINLTKMAGAGSLAHEWWHALEHHIAKKLGASEHTAVNLRPSAMKNDPELAAAVEELHDSMHYSQDESANKAELQRVAEAQERRKQKLADTNREARENGTTVYDPQSPEDFLHNIRMGMKRTLSYKKKEAKPELMKQYEEIESKLKAGDLGGRAGSTTHGFVPIYANIQALSDLHKKITGRGLLAKDAEGDKWLRRIYWDNLKLEKPKTEAAKVENKPKRTVRSKFKIEADKLDHSRSSPYYGLPHEMAARAFEAYVEDKLKEKGIQSDYLVGQGKTDSAFYKAFGLDAPFPEGDERKQINAAFDKLLAAVRKHLRKPETERHSLADEARELSQRVQRIVERYSAAPQHDEKHIAIGKRFGIPPEAVKSVLETHPDELASRDHYLPPSSGRDSVVGPTTDYPKHLVGAAKIDAMRHKAGETDNAYVEYLREFNPAELVTSEHEDGISKTEPFRQYVEWAKAGKQAPPISVFSKPGGKMVSTNRRRVLAAQQAGSKSIMGWHGADNPETGLPLKYGDVKRAFAELAKPATDLLGQPVKPTPKPKAVFDSTKGKQQTLFAGLNAKEGQMNLFADAGVPDELVAKPQQPAQKELFSAVREALVERYAAQQSPWFLRSARVLAEKMGQHAPASQVLATLRNNQVSPEELKWTGLEKHLLSKGNQPVSQQELHDLIGQFNVGEKVLGDRGHSDKLRKFIAETGWREDIDGPLHDYIYKMGTEAHKAKLHDKAEEFLQLGNEAWEKRQAGNEPKYASYALPGGQNYREMLLTLPQSGSPRAVKHPKHDGFAIQFPDGSYATPNGSPDPFGLGGDGGTTVSPENAAVWATESDARKYGIPFHDKNSHQSGHWDDPNVLAHVRYQDFIGPDGKKHLHIDEIQSDWHQQGRKQGYLPTSEEKNAASEQIKTLRAQQQRHEPGSEQWKAIDEQIIPLGRVAGGGRTNQVPDAPFKNNWHMLAMKRMMHHAAANGYDRVTWTPGEEHASRYDLSKHVHGIHYHPESKHLVVTSHDGNDVINGQLHDGVIHDETPNGMFHKKHIDEVLGKETAARLFSQPTKEEGPYRHKKDWQSLQGDGLKLGGEGMKGFYDRMLPNDTNKLIKKHGGKVGQFDLHVHDQFHDSDGMPTSTAPRAMKVHGFDVTPSMKAEATGGKGQSMFSVYEDGDWRIERYEQAGDRQPKFRIDAGMKAASQQTPPSTKPPAIFGAIGGLASKAGNWLQDKADKVAGKIGGAAQKLDQKGQAAMAKVGLADKVAAPAKPKSSGVKAGAPLMFNGDHSINGGQTSIPKGTQGKLVGPHQDPKNVVVDVGGQHHVVPKSLLLHDLRHTDHKAVEKSKQEAQQAQADQQAKVRQMTARQRAEAVPDGAGKAKLKNMNIGSHELQVGDVVNHSTPGLHPYGRVLEVSPDGKKIKIEEAARAKGAPGGIATTGRHVWIDGHEKIGDTGAVGTRSFPVLRTPDEYRPIGERKEYKEAYEGAKKLGLNDDQAHEMAMQMWDDLQAKNNPKPKPAPAAQQPAQAQPKAAQAKPAGSPKPRHHAESLQAGDTLRMLKGSDTGTNLKFIGRSKQPGMVEVEHPTLGRQTFRSRDLGLYVPGSPKAAGPSFTDQMKKGYDRSSPDMHTVKRSEFAGQKHGVLAKDQQGRGFLLYGGKKFALQPNEFDGKKLIGDNAGVKIRERIHREQIQALASKDPSAVPSHVREEYDHHWDKWSGNSSFAKSGGKPAQGPAQVPTAGPVNPQMQPAQARPQINPELREQIEEMAGKLQSDGVDPATAQQQALNHFLLADAAEIQQPKAMFLGKQGFKQGLQAPPSRVKPAQKPQAKAAQPQITPEGQAASPPPTQPAGAASAPSGVNPPTDLGSVPTSFEHGGTGRTIDEFISDMGGAQGRLGNLKKLIAAGRNSKDNISAWVLPKLEGGYTDEKLLKRIAEWEANGNKQPQAAAPKQQTVAPPAAATPAAKPQAGDELMDDWRAANPMPRYTSKGPGGPGWEDVERWQKRYHEELAKRQAAQATAPASGGSNAPPQAAKPQSPNLRALVRPYQAGRNTATIQFADELQRDLHDYAAAQGRRRQFSGKAGGQQPRQAAQLESALNRIAADHFGGDKDAAHLAALQTLAHVKAHMRGVGDGQHKIIPPTSAGLPAEPQQPATATATNTGRLTKLPRNPTPRQAEQHVNTMVNRHMREFAAQEAMHAQKLVNAWKVYREKMGIPSDRRFKGARDLKEALAQGADSQGVGLKNFDVWADQLHKDFPWAFSDRDGSKDESAIFDFFASDPPAIPKASDPELQDKFWAAVTPEYKKHLEMMRMGEVPLEHLDLSQQMGDDMRDWEAHRRANDNFSAFQDALVERFSVFWQSSGGMNGRQAGKQRNPSLTV